MRFWLFWLQEEWRLAHVAATRARDHLFLLSHRINEGRQWAGQPVCHDVYQRLEKKGTTRVCLPTKVALPADSDAFKRIVHPRTEGERFAATIMSTYDFNHKEVYVDNYGDPEGAGRPSCVTLRCCMTDFGVPGGCRRIRSERCFASSVLQAPAQRLLVSVHRHHCNGGVSAPQSRLFANLSVTSSVCFWRCVR